jgi:hypothetical protein
MMTEESDSNRDKTKLIDRLNYILDALVGFQDNYTKKFNLSKLMEYLKVPPSEGDKILYLIFHFQDFFNDVFKNHQLKRKIEQGNIYFIAEKKDGIPIPEIIMIRRSTLPFFSDLIYLFKYVKRGKGFNLEINDNDLLRKIKEIRKEYPYLFEGRGNGLIYPSKLGLKFGEIILSYNKSNKEFTDIQIDTHTFKVINDQ